MKITFTAKIIADVSNDQRDIDHPFDMPTMEWVGVLLQNEKCDIEYIPCWDNSAEPTLVITEKSNA